MSVVDKITKTGASAFQGDHPDGSQIVSLDSIRVAIYPHGRFWLAQAMEIDYIAQGDDPDSAKKAFEDGLEATIHHHIRIFGDIKKLLKFAPARVRLKVLDQVFKHPGSTVQTYSQVSVHDVLQKVKPISIEYLTLSAAA